MQQDTVKSGGIDSVVTYASADSIVFTFTDKQMHLFGKGDVRYKDLSLKSERINVNWNTNNLEAVGVLDTTKLWQTDSLKKRYTGTPVMIEGSDTYEGWKITYNFKSQKGRVTLGETAMEQGFYYGEQIKKVDRDMMFISNGMFTTCENGHPHFYFFTPEMRMTVRDKIVARPIYMYISDVPIFALPFGVFPSQGGRRSGIIAPAYSDRGRQGTGLEHFGYYEAINDYMDFSLVGDWFTSGTWRASPTFRYAKRYDFTGALSGYYRKTIENEPRDFDRVEQSDYLATIVHNQVFNPTTRLDVNFSFASSESYRRSYTQSEYLNQYITSNATFTKSWEGTGNSMTANISRSQDLRLGNIDATLPSISFSTSQAYPFRRTLPKGASISSDSYSWYEMIGFSYSANALRRESKTRPTDSSKFTLYEREGINHSPNITFTPPKLGYFSVSPYFSYNEKWYNRYSAIGGYDALGNPIAVDKKGFEAVRTFSAGLNGSTKFYGILNSPIPGIAGFRHTVSPVINYNYTPDFSEKKWGYYTRYTDVFGREQKFNRFQKEIFGGAPAGEQQAINLRVGNLFEMKTAAKDSTQKEQKYQLMNIDGGIGYNFVADSLKLSALDVGYRTDIASIVNVSGSARYNFYEFDQKANTRVNRFLLEQGKGIAQLTSFSINVSTSFSGERKQATTQQQVADSSRAADQQRNRQSGYQSIYQDEIPDFSIPWNISFNFSFSQNQENPKVKYRSANLSANLGFNLTENWKFTANASYDVVSKQLAAPSVNIYRDLHCWEMNFNWVPLGSYSGYRFEIRVKAPQLQDIKVTKQNRNSW